MKDSCDTCKHWGKKDSDGDRVCDIRGWATFAASHEGCKDHPCYELDRILFEKL